MTVRGTTACLLIALALAGCSGSAKDTEEPAADLPELKERTDNVTLPPPNTAPVASLEVDVLNGTAPLGVNVTLGAVDGEANPLAWELDFGDGTATVTGDLLPVTLNHTYLVAGNFTLVLTVSDGLLSANATAAVAVLAAPVATEYSCTVDVPLAAVMVGETPAGHLGSCDFTTTAAATILAAAELPAGCAVTIGAEDQAVGNEIPSGTTLEMRCRLPTNTDGGTGTIALVAA